MVLLNSPCRETPKNVPPKTKEKIVGWWVGGGLRFSKCTGWLVRRILLAGPSSVVGPLAPRSRGSEPPAGGRVSLGYVLGGCLAPVIGRGLGL
jgi:hypothetical protein